VQKALADQAHPEGLVKVEVVDAEKLDVLAHLEEQSLPDLDPLRGDFVAGRSASDPIDNVRDAEREHDSEPLPGAGRWCMEVA